MTMLRAIRDRLPETKDDGGRVVLLIAGLFGILAVLIVGGVNVTALQLARMQVIDAADAAAANAADAADESSLYKHGLGAELSLSDRSVQQAAGSTLAREDVPAHVTGWRVADGTGAQDSRTAVVRVSAVVHPPILGGMVSGMFGDIHITVQSRARADVK
ncbi:pilus assembly protein TadG-related protein [Flexivirga sp. B27]